MLLFRYIIENLRFFYRWLHPNFKLRKVKYGNIKQWYMLDTPKKREYYLPYDSNYNWKGLRKSLKTLGYIPSIVTKERRDNDGITHIIVDGNHRFFILSGLHTKNNFIKIWVNKRRSKDHAAIMEGDRLTEKRIKEAYDNLNKHINPKKRQFPNYKN